MISDPGLCRRGPGLPLAALAAFGGGGLSSLAASPLTASAVHRVVTVSFATTPGTLGVIDRGQGCRLFLFANSRVSVVRLQHGPDQGPSPPGRRGWRLSPPRPPAVRLLPRRR